MYAVIATGGKQMTVREGDTILVERLANDPGSEVVFDQVLFVSNDGKYNVGAPVVKNASVVGELLCEEKGDKINVFKFKKRKDLHKKTGHRQTYSKVKIKEIRS